MVNAIGSTHSAWHESLGDASTVYRDGRDGEGIEIDGAARSVLSIGRSRSESGGDNPSGLLRHEAQLSKGIVYPLASNLVGDDAHLARRHADSSNDCFGFHGLSQGLSPLGGSCPIPQAGDTAGCAIYQIS